MQLTVKGKEPHADALDLAVGSGLRSTTVNKIGRLTTDGQVTEYSLPTPNSAPREITVGSDDALWFVAMRGRGGASLAHSVVA